MSADEVKSFDDDMDGEDNSTKGRKRAATGDEALLNTDDVRKLENRRAYNRQCAAKARKRSKELVAHLQAQVEDLTKEKAELKRENEVMRAQVELLENQNKALMMNQLVNQQGIAGPMNQSMNPNSQSLLNNAALLNASTAANSLLGSNGAPQASNPASGLLSNSFLQQGQQMPQQNNVHQDLTALLSRLQESNNQNQLQQQLQQHLQQQQQLQRVQQQQQQQQASSQDSNSHSQIAALLGLTSLLSSSAAAAAIDSNKGPPKL